MIVPLQKLPTHKDLPETDGSIVENFQELPLGILLSDSIRPHLDRLHPDRQYCIGQDSGIYWSVTDPPLDGCKSPDWYYVPGVPPLLDGELRRSYVMWNEVRAPIVVIEFVSGDGSEEHDATPETGKFWVYEQAIRAPFYAIFDGWRGTLEVYGLVFGAYQLLEPNERGHYPIPQMKAELGLWRGTVLNYDNKPWVRWWDEEGNMLLTGHEIAEQEHQRAEQERQRAEQERQRADHSQQKLEQLRERLRALGMDPDQLS